MSFASSCFSTSFISIILLTSACAQNITPHKNDNHDDKNHQLLQLQKIGDKFNNINFSGAYLAARSARLYYDFDAAQKNSENSFVLTPMTDPYLADQAIRLSLIKQDFDTAVALANQHISKFSDKTAEEVTENVVGTFSIIALLADKIKRNQPKEALEIFEKFQNSFNKPMRALIGGTVYRFNNDFKKAELIESNLSGFALFDMMRSFHAANSAYVAGDTDKALLLFKKSGKYIDPLAVRSVLSAVQIHLEKGEKDKALELLKTHRKNQPDGLLWAAATSIEKGEDFKFDLPKNYIQSLGEDLYNIGILYARQNDYESAIAFLRTSQICGVSHAYLLSALAETFALIRDYDQSSELYLSIAKNEKFLIGRESLVGAAFTLNAAKRYKETDKLLKDAIEADPTYYRYPYILADLLRGREDYQEAIPYFTKALSLIDERGQKVKWRTLYGRGISYEQTKQWEKAERDLLEALKLAPNNPDLVNYLAYSWVDRGVHLDKALLMLQHAVKRRPNSGYIADSLGWAYFRMKKYAEALPILEDAAALMPHDPVINDHLGDVYWKMDRQREAVFQWKHALDFEPTDKNRQNIEAKIAVGYDKADQYKPEKKNDISANQKNMDIDNGSFFNTIKSFINRVSGKQE
ncbi:MAG: tetratricopeptide (TPR) repeat protein [Alphaproteobacteria bacterium]|jgi:tetratricopeptide (TPR) repeat protein